MKRFLIPIAAFLFCSALIAGVYFGILTWAQGWNYASSQFLLNRWYVVPIWGGFGIQAALYSILRFRLFIPTISTGHAGAVMGTSGATSTAAMVACCLHHAADVLPILGLSAAATFLTRYQRPFMLVGLGMEIIGITVMLVVLYRERKRLQPVQKISTCSGDEMKRFTLPLLLALALILVACAPPQVGTNPAFGTSQFELQPVATPSTGPVPSLGNNTNASADLRRSDGQGMVTVEVTPLDLGHPSDKLEFDVALNTHSVDLSMDLATLSTLATDTGITIQATSWDGTPGGHHVSGKLIFPSKKDGKSILDGASKLTLTIIKVDAPSRVFEWQLK